MTRYLLDVNVIIALVDPAHVHHDAIHKWFASIGRKAWATCPTVENGVTRVLCNPAYPNATLGTAAIGELLRRFVAVGGHERWIEDVTLLDEHLFDLRQVVGHRQVTDVYLLGLCQRMRGTLATLDKRITTAAVVGARAELLEVIAA